MESVIACTAWLLFPRDAPLLAHGCAVVCRAISVMVGYIMLRNLLMVVCASHFFEIYCVCQFFGFS